jgi:hypothetical protein
VLEEAGQTVRFFSQTYLDDLLAGWRVVMLDHLEITHARANVPASASGASPPGPRPGSSPRPTQRRPFNRVASSHSQPELAVHRADAVLDSCAAHSLSARRGRTARDLFGGTRRSSGPRGCSVFELLPASA